MKKWMICLWVLALIGLCPGAMAARGTRRTAEETEKRQAAMESEEKAVYAVLSAQREPAGPERVFYEIFPGSFSDSDGDGIGDLKGVLRRLDYLNDGDPASRRSLGVQGIWLTPVFASPSYHKYDITDYYAIDPAFGTMEDLKNLIDACHERDMLLILDLPLNHTSSAHPWFREFTAAHQAGETGNPYYDFYTHAGEERDLNRTWYPLEGTGEYYEGNFSSDMPELNFDNEAVRQAVLDIGRFYLKMGADGFRFDAAKYIYLEDGARSVAFWQWYTEQLRAISPQAWLVAEVWDSDPVILPYLSAMNCFNFTVAGAEGLTASAAAGGSVRRFTDYMTGDIQNHLAARPDAFPVPFLSNHDMDRSAGYLPDSNGRARIAANLYLLSPGAPFIYYGEEIGLRGSRGGANTDANRRLAMPWGDGDTVRDPEGADYDKQTDATVASMTDQPDSLLHYYRLLIAIRKAHPEIARGEYQSLDPGDTKVGGFIARLPGSAVLVLHNPTQRTQTLELKEEPFSGFRSISAFIGCGLASLEGDTLTLEGQTSVILR